MFNPPELSPAEKALAEKQRELRRKYKEFGGAEKNKQVANSIAVSAAIEYEGSSTLGWGGVYMLDRFQSMITGRAITTNTQKTLDAEELSKEAPRGPGR